MTESRVRAAALACLFTASQAWGFGPPGSGGFGGGYSGSSGSSGSGSSGFPGVNGNGNGSSFLGFDVTSAMRYRSIHGILAALAFVILFPMGSIFMRVVPGRFAIWVHALTQLIAYAVFIAAAALGFYLVSEVQIPFDNGNLLSNSNVNYHPIIGIVILAVLLVQPVLGLIHHSKFKRLQRRTIWSHMHLWNGRFAIAVGIINGGIGLRISNAPNNLRTAYGIVAAIMGFLWIATAIFGEIRRRRTGRRAAVRQEPKGPTRMRRLSSDHDSASVSDMSHQPTRTRSHGHGGGRVTV